MEPTENSVEDNLHARLHAATNFQEFCLLIRGLRPDEFENDILRTFAGREELVEPDEERRTWWTNPFSILEQDLLSRILSFLHPIHQFKIAATSRAFNTAASPHIDSLCLEQNGWKLDRDYLPATNIPKSILNNLLHLTIDANMSHIQDVLDLATRAETIVFETTSRQPPEPVTVGPACESVHLVIRRGGERNSAEGFASKVKSITNESNNSVVRLACQCPNLEELTSRFNRLHAYFSPTRKWFIDILMDECPSLRKIVLTNFRQTDSTKDLKSFLVAMMRSTYPSKGIELHVLCKIYYDEQFCKVAEMFRQSQSRCCWTHTLIDEDDDTEEDESEEVLVEVDRPSSNFFSDDQAALLLRRYQSWPAEHQRELLRLSQSEVKVVVEDARSLQMRCFPFELLCDDALGVVLTFFSLKQRAILARVCTAMDRVHRTAEMVSIAEAVLENSSGSQRSWENGTLRIPAGRIEEVCKAQCYHGAHVRIGRMIANKSIETLYVNGDLCEFLVDCVAEHASSIVVYMEKFKSSLITNQMDEWKAEMAKWHNETEKLRRKWVNVGSPKRVTMQLEGGFSFELN